MKSGKIEFVMERKGSGYDVHVSGNITEDMVCRALLPSVAKSAFTTVKRSHPESSDDEVMNKVLTAFYEAEKYLLANHMEEKDGE